jgi:hypothetical protein
MTTKGKNKKHAHRSPSGVKAPRNTTSTAGRKVPQSLKESLMAGMDGHVNISIAKKGTRRSRRK